MGRNKLLLDVGGEPLVRRCVQVALAAQLDPVLVVLGHEADAVRGALASLPCRFVMNPRHADGMNGSVCAGIAALPLDVGATIVLLADMPFVDVNMISTLMAQRRGGAALVLSEYNGVVAPPTLVDRSLFADMASEAGRGCAKRLRRRHPNRSATVKWSAAALADLDLAEDYERVKARLMMA
jgi:molybdenum cofactor cytidylyltransferase